MPILNWLTREADLQKSRRAPYRLLEPVPEMGYGDPAAGNLLLQGDNLEHSPKVVMNEIFGRNNFVANVLWQKRTFPTRDWGPSVLRHTAREGGRGADRIESEDDWFDYRLENGPRFLKRIEAARKSLQAGKGIRLEDV